MNKNNSPLSASLEDYLEAIIALERKNRVARVRDIAKRLKVSMPSVTGALKSLRYKGYIDYEANNLISLTPLGVRAANCVASKHEIMQRFLTDVLVLSEERAMSMSGQMVHAVDCETNRRLIRLLDFFINKNGSGGVIEAASWREFIKNTGKDIPFVCSEWCDDAFKESRSVE